MIGGLVAGGFVAASRHLPGPRLAPGVMIAALAIVCLTMHGHRAGSQQLITPPRPVSLGPQRGLYARALRGGDRVRAPHEVSTV